VYRFYVGDHLLVVKAIPRHKLGERRYIVPGTQFVILKTWQHRNEFVGYSVKRFSWASQEILSLAGSDLEGLERV